MFLMELYPIVADSRRAKTIKVSKLVGQTGLPNLTQKMMNCFRLLLWFLLVPSAYILDCESLAFSNRVLNSSSTVRSELGGEGGGVEVEGGGGGGEDRQTGEELSWLEKTNGLVGVESAW